MSARQKRMTCWVCKDGIISTIDQAKRHGWSVWVGGAICRVCLSLQSLPQGAKPGDAPVDGKQ